MQNPARSTDATAKPARRDRFADARRIRPVLPDSEIRSLLAGWAGPPPMRVKLGGIELAALVLDTGRGFPVESVHVYARKGVAWHRLEHLPAKADGTWRYTVKAIRNVLTVEVDRLVALPGSPKGRSTVVAIGAENLRERYLRLPAEPLRSR